MAFSNADTGIHPDFATKKALIREVLALGVNVPGVEDLAYRINNSTAFSDFATVYLPTDTFNSA